MAGRGTGRRAGGQERWHELLASIVVQVWLSDCTVRSGRSRTRNGAESSRADPLRWERQLQPVGQGVERRVGSATSSHTLARVQQP